jgi:Flp pilus assembly protein TadG
MKKHLRLVPSLPALRRGNARPGAAVVEFAVLAPLLFLLIFGMIEYGRMVMVQQLITNASREGARVAILAGTTNAIVIDTVQEKLGSAVPCLDSDVTTNPADITTAAPGESVTVTVGVNFADVSWLPNAFWLGGKRLTASSAMRVETVQ